MHYFISDLHFGHWATLVCFHRPFLSVEDMDEFMIRLWNKRVKAQDRVYLCGDVSFSDLETTKAILRRLKGKKILLQGNHDGELCGDPEAAGLFEEIAVMLQREVDGRRLCLCHYPMLEWPGDREDGWLVFGHVHNRQYGKTYDALMTMPRALNAGVDINQFMPVTFEELWKNNERFYGFRAPLEEEE